MIIYRLTIRDDMGCCVDVYGDEGVLRLARDEWVSWRKSRAMKLQEACATAKSVGDDVIEAGTVTEFSVDADKELTVHGISNTCDRAPTEYTIPMDMIRTMSLVKMW